jgi:predicted nuclease with TOPRIM domain
MKMTIVTDGAGKIIGAVQGHALSEKVGEVEARVSFPAGHVLHHVDVGADLANITDAAEFQNRLAQHLPTA